MFYFFRRGREFVRFEVRTTDADTYQIVTVGPDGKTEIKEYPTARELNAEWTGLQQELLRHGWWGPYGRD